jgi:hypothetical protein
MTRWTNSFEWRKRPLGAHYHLFLDPTMHSLCNGVEYGGQPANCIPEPDERCPRCEALALVLVGLTIEDTEQAGLRIKRFQDVEKE